MEHFLTPFWNQCRKVMNSLCLNYKEIGSMPVHFKTKVVLPRCLMLICWYQRSYDEDFESWFFIQLFQKLCRKPVWSCRSIYHWCKVIFIGVIISLRGPRKILSFILLTSTLYHSLPFSKWDRALIRTRNSFHKTETDVSEVPVRGQPYTRRYLEFDTQCTPYY